MKLGNKLEFSTQLDNDGELEIDIELESASGSQFINKKEAIALMNHLIKTFDIKLHITNIEIAPE